MRERLLRTVFALFAVSLAVAVGASAYMAYETGYTYGQAVRLALYPTLVVALAPVLGLAVLGLVTVAFSFGRRIDRLEHGMLRWLDARADWVPSTWDEDVERTLVEGVQIGEWGYEGAEVQEALVARRDLRQERRWAVRLFGVPVVALTVIVAFSQWAIPASGGFLDALALLNTAFVFLTTYGLFVALPALVAALGLGLRG